MIEHGAARYARTPWPQASHATAPTKRVAPLCIYIYIYIYIYMCFIQPNVYIYIYTHTYLLLYCGAWREPRVGHCLRPVLSRTTIIIIIK